MKKSHPIRHRALAVRRGHKARTLAHRRQVEVLAALMGFRRALQDRPFRGVWSEVAAAVVERLRARPFNLASIFGPSITYDATPLWKKWA